MRLPRLEDGTAEVDAIRVNSEDETEQHVQFAPSLGEVRPADKEVDQTTGQVPEVALVEELLNAPPPQAAA
jgi:hypothetical protein